VNKDEWDTKEGPGKSIKNALCVHVYSDMAKGTFRAEAMQIIKPVALAIVEL